MSELLILEFGDSERLITPLNSGVIPRAVLMIRTDIQRIIYRLPVMEKKVKSIWSKLIILKRRKSPQMDRISDLESNSSSMEEEGSFSSSKCDNDFSIPGLPTLVLDSY